MWPRIGPIPTYGILYLLGIIAHFLVSRHAAKRLGLTRRVWIAVSVCYFVGMNFGAKLLYDVHHSQLDLTALLKVKHYLGGGFWGGLVAKNAPNSKAPEIDASFDLFEIREELVVERPVNIYALPAGSAARDAGELLKFIENLRNFHLRTEWEAAEYQRRARGVMTLAARQILSLEKDEWSKAFQTALLVLLEDRVRMMERASPVQQQQTLAQVKTFLTAKAEKGLQPQDADPAVAAAAALESGGNFELAAQAYGDFAKLVARSKDEEFSGTAEMLEGAVRRVGLPGEEMKLEGTEADGSRLDWSAYRGKVVLVHFWATGSQPCRAELPGIKLNHQLYHDRGSEVVGISTDRDRRSLEEFLKKEQLPWVTLHEKDPDARHPMVTYYGVTGVPTALLVDKQGTVVSLRARGGELDGLLEKLIGPPYVPKGKLTYIDLQPKANLKLTADFDSLNRSNNLAGLPQGEQTFGGVKLKIGEGLIHLGHGRRPEFPTKVEGIPVVLGEDVRDWWDNDGSKAVTRGKVVWAGRNPASRSSNSNLRLYLTAWDNPQPGKKVLSMDFVELPAGNAAPFCVAMTVEGEAAVDTSTDGPAPTSPPQ